jgi:hypothetical protein
MFARVSRGICGPNLTTGLFRDARHAELHARSGVRPTDVRYDAQRTRRESLSELPGKNPADGCVEKGAWTLKGKPQLRTPRVLLLPWGFGMRSHQATHPQRA